MKAEKGIRQRFHPEPHCYTVNDAARWLGTDPSVVKRAVAEGQLEMHYYFGSGYGRILESDLEEFVRMQPSSPAK